MQTSSRSITLGILVASFKLRDNWLLFHSTYQRLEPLPRYTNTSELYRFCLTRCLRGLAETLTALPTLTLIVFYSYLLHIFLQPIEKSREDREYYKLVERLDCGKVYIVSKFLMSCLLMPARFIQYTNVLCQAQCATNLTKFFSLLLLQ